MKETDKEILRKLCLYYRKEYDCSCAHCALYGLVWCANKVYDKGWTMEQALRCYDRLKFPKDEGKKILEEKLGIPLHIVQMLLREIKDFEECHDV